MKCRRPDSYPPPQLRTSHLACLQALPEQADECCMCMCVDADVLFRPCGHQVICKQCCTQLFQAVPRPEGRLCPVCREPVAGAYHAMAI